MDWYALIVAVGSTLGLAFFVLVVWLIFVLLDTATEAKRYYRRENENAHRQD